MRLKRQWQRIRSIGVVRYLGFAAQRVLFLKPFSFFERLGLHVLPVHHYSPVPDTRELRRNRDRWFRESSMPGVRIDVAEQLPLLDAFRGFQPEIRSLPAHERLEAMGLGEGFGEVESQILYSFVRHTKPRTVVEVGGGTSTFISIQALEANKRLDDIDGRLVTIEPFPANELSKLRPECGWQLIRKPVQAVSPEFFDALDSGDILFIDSSHIAKLGSDVMHLYLEVVPRLRAGVRIHIHDISFPYPSSDPEEWVFTRHQFWTEPAIVQAFLAFNDSFRILLCSSYLHYKAPHELAKTFPDYDPNRHFPSSLWLERVR